MSLSEKISKKNLIFLALIVSNLGFATVSGIFISNSINTNKTYEEAYQDYLNTLDDLNATEEELQNALDDLQQAEAELQLNEDNTAYSGTFYVLSQYNKNYDSTIYLLKSEFSYSEYFFFRLSLNHPDFSSSHSHYEIAQIIAGYCRPSSVQSLAEYIASNVDYPSDDECVIDGLLTYCQDRGDFESCIHYIEDGVDDFAKYPVETLCEGCGDCEDKAILFASMVRAVGYDVRICIVPGHAFVAVKLGSAPAHGDGWHLSFDDGNYYTCETTAYGWLIGDLHPDYQGESVYSYQVL